MVVFCLFVIEIVGSTMVGFDYNRKKQEGWIPSFVVILYHHLSKSSRELDYNLVSFMKLLIDGCGMKQKSK